MKTSHTHTTAWSSAAVDQWTHHTQERVLSIYLPLHSVYSNLTNLNLSLLPSFSFILPSLQQRFHLLSQRNCYAVPMLASGRSSFSYWIHWRWSSCTSLALFSYILCHRTENIIMERKLKILNSNNYYIAANNCILQLLKVYILFSLDEKVIVCVWLNFFF